MSYVDDVRNAASPKAALTVIALVLDELAARITKLEAGDDWDSWDDAADEEQTPENFTADTNSRVVGGREGIMPDSRPPMGAVTVEETANGPVYVFPEPDEARRQQRALLERQQLKIAQALGDDAGHADWTAAYVKGGPFWLYQHRRDLVMSYDFATRQRMVADVEQDSPRLAYEMGLDVLKQPAGAPDLDTGAGALAVSNLTSDKAKAHVHK